MSNPPAEEPQGCNSIMGFVKSRPENNKHYLDQYIDHPWYPILVRTDDSLEQIIPGYNIGQIKEKFGGLRYYFDFPGVIPVGEYRWNDTEEKVKARAEDTVRYAEAWVAGFEYHRAMVEETQ